jgi:hypothetical protein
MTAVDARARLVRLTAEWLGGGGDAADVAACRVAFVGLAVTEIASFRAELSGPQLG